MSRKTILVAAHEIRGGTKAGPWVIDAGTPITPGLKKSHGLDADEVAALLDKGAVKEVSAHAPGPDDLAEELAAEKARAGKAEGEAHRLAGEVSTLTARVAELEAQLEAATARVAELEAQLEAATAPADGKPDKGPAEKADKA